MNRTAQLEMFPELKRATKRVEKKQTLRSVQGFLRVCQAHYGLLPQVLVSKISGRSKARVGELVEARRLASVDVFGMKLVSARSVLSWLQNPRKPGRPKISKAVAASVEENATKSRRKVRRNKNAR